LITLKNYTHSLLPMTKNNFNKTLEGKQTKLYTLTNKNGVKVEITNYGATIVSIHVPDKNGKFKDIALGYDSIDEYISGNVFLGATVGRFANRIANGKFNINGKTYHVAVNNGKNHLHGGLKGFNTVVWDASSIEGKQTLELEYISKDGEENYPGNLSTKIIYRLTEENELQISYQATTDKTTIVNLTHHSYFNLAGEGNTSILDHELMIDSDQFTPLNNNQIPTGEYRETTNTPFDFKKLTPIGKRIDIDNEQLKIGSGYDHNWILKNNKNKVALVAAVHEPISGRYLEVFTNQPGIQCYTSNFLNDIIGKSGKTYHNRSAFCLETQHFPDSPNQSNFPSTILEPNENYAYTCIYKFSVK